MISVVDPSVNRLRQADGQDNSGVADLRDAAARWRAPVVDADAARAPLGNVVLFSRARRDGAAGAAAPELSTAERPPIVAAQSRPALRWAALLAASVAAHVALYLPFGREPPPMASLGEVVISVEIIPGANEAAGLIPDQGESAASNPAPAQAPDAVAEQPPEPPAAEIAKAEPVPEQPQAPVELARLETTPVETEAPAQQVVEQTEPAEKPPEQVAALEAEQPPSPPQPLAPVEATPEPTAPAQVQAAPLATAAPAAELQAAVNPETPPTVTTTSPPETAKPKPTPVRPNAKPTPKKPEAKPPVAREKHNKTRRAAVRGERNESQSTGPASVAAGGRGRGRSEANSNYAGLVHARLRQYLRYPEEARSRGDRGTAAVAFTLDSGGRVTSVRLSRGTGNPALDHEATAVVRRASPFPPPPGGRGQSFTAPVGFNIR